MLRRLKKIGKKLLVLLLLFYIGGVWIYGCADALVLGPSVDRRDPGPATEMRIPHEGRVMQAYVMRAPNGQEPEAYSLCFVGTGSRAEDVAQYNQMKWGPRPVETWTVNYAGYGGSTGPARLTSIPPDALFAYDELKKKAGDKPIYVDGMSLGTTAALYVAAHRSVAGVICQNPPALRSLIIGEHGWWNLWLLAIPVAAHIPSDLDSVANAARCTAPAIFMLAANDTFVLPKYQHRVADAYVGPKVYIVLQGADHNSALNSKQFDQLRAAVDAWQPAASAVATTKP